MGKKKSGCWLSRELPKVAKGITSLSPPYLFSLIINDGCFKLRNSAREIQFRPGPRTVCGKKSSVLKVQVLAALLLFSGGHISNIVNSLAVYLLRECLFGDTIRNDNSVIRAANKQSCPSATRRTAVHKSTAHTHQRVLEPCFVLRICSVLCELYLSPTGSQQMPPNQVISLSNSLCSWRKQQLFSPRVMTDTPVVH